MPRSRRAVPGVVVAVAFALTLAGACTQVSTDPNSVLSLELFPPQLPSVVKGSVLRDTLGAVAPMQAAAWNNQGAPVTGAPIKFIYLFVPDTLHPNPKLEVVDSTGVVTGKDTAAVAARVIASVAGLQTLPQPIFVVDSPTTVVPVDSVRLTFSYNQGTFKGMTVPLDMHVQRVLGIDTVGIPHYRLRFAFTDGTYNPGDTLVDRLLIVNSALHHQLVDTTNADGKSNLSVLATLLSAPVTHDTVRIDVAAYMPDQVTPLPGSPVHFVIDLTICNTGTTAPACP